MANTVSLLSYANTFGDWVVTTNALTKENNDIAANNYIKPTGTLYLNDSSLGLQVAKGAIFAGQVQIQGIGSSAYVQNNLRVDTQVYFQNTILGLTNSGQAIIGGLLSANGSGIGLAVANNTTIGGYLRVTGNSSITGATALGNTLSVVGSTTLSNTLSVTGAATMASTLDVTNNGTFGNNLTILNDTSSYNFIAGGASNTGTLLARNGGVVTGSFVVSGSSYLNNVTANSTVYTPILNATNYATVNGLTSNTIVRTTTSNISGTEYVDTIVANTSISVPTLTVTSAFSACNATLSANSITVGTGGLSVIGNFTINGTTVYNTPSFTLSASTPNQTSYINVYRTSTPAGNASIKWDQSNTYWSIADVAGSTPTYYRILTTQQLTDSVSTTSSLLAASATAVKTVQDNMTTANTSMKSYVDTANTSLKSYVDNNVTTANTSMKSYVDNNITIVQGVDNTQNTRLTVIEGIDVSQNARMTIIEGTDSSQNTRMTVIESVDNTQNTRLTVIEGTDVSQNTRMTNIESVDTAQNVRLTVIEGTDVSQNTRMTNIESSVTTQTNNLAATNGKMQSGYNQANTGIVLAQAGFDTANNRVSSVSGTAGRISSTGGLTPTLDLVAAGPGASSATNASLTIDAYGRVTALSSGTAPVTSITGTSNQITVTGTTTPTLSLPQSIATGSSVQFGSFGVGTGASGTSGEIRATNNITAYYSDDRLKTRIGNIANALQKVNTLNGFHYTANETAQAFGYTVKPEVGLSAQEVQAVLPEVVVPAPIDDKYLTIHYERVIPLLVEAIKELSREVEELKKK